MPYSLDFLQQVVNTNWETDCWVLLNAQISGSNPSSAPPYGSFGFILPKTVKLLQTMVVAQSQGGGVANHFYYFPWNTLVDPPTLANYRTVQPGHGGNLLFAWSVTDTLRGYPNDPSFPPPDNSFWYSTAAKAAAAAAIIPTVSSDFYFADLADFLTNTFSGSNSGPPVLSYGVQVINDPTSSFHTVLQIKYLLKVSQQAATSFGLIANVPGGCNVNGWASIFTSKKPITNILSVAGLADQTVTLGGAQTHTFQIRTTGKLGHGTISADGVSGTTPGLAANAPLPGSGG